MLLEQLMGRVAGNRSSGDTYGDIVDGVEEVGKIEEREWVLLGEGQKRGGEGEGEEMDSFMEEDSVVRISAKEESETAEREGGEIGADEGNEYEVGEAEAATPVNEIRSEDGGNDEDDVEEDSVDPETRLVLTAMTQVHFFPPSATYLRFGEILVLHAILALDSYLYKWMLLCVIMIHYKSDC